MVVKAVMTMTPYNSTRGVSSNDTQELYDTSACIIIHTRCTKFTYTYILISNSSSSVIF